jgi:dUTP pyrophosphatase
MKRDVEILVLSEAPLPEYASIGAAGADVRAHLAHPLVIPPRKSALVPTGVRCEIPSGYEIQIRPRSGLAVKHQVTVLNTPGTIDEDYRGEIFVCLINHGEEAFTVEPRMRIAQLVVAPACRASFTKVEALSESERGSKGFGHTGLN